MVPSNFRENPRNSCAVAFVQGAPGGIGQPVNERGSTLSACQGQLMSFARAVAHDPAIFVLDEAS